MKYKESNLYKQGIFFKKFSELLLDEKTTINQLATFGYNCGVKFSIALEENKKKKKAKK